MAEVQLFRIQLFRLQLFRLQTANNKLLASSLLLLQAFAGKLLRVLQEFELRAHGCLSSLKWTLNSFKPELAISLIIIRR